MTVIEGVLLVGAVTATGLYLLAKRVRRRQEAARREKCRERLHEHERRREAHYMQNFWNYDGSVQEEFRE
ncbi:MAG: hypothetical protein IJC52_03710 [Clostridia bacterium]|nr:hypothetical protein [Clostridia bacterium]